MFSGFVDGPARLRQAIWNHSTKADVAEFIPTRAAAAHAALELTAADSFACSATSASG
jgi:hypothetical protein